MLEPEKSFFIFGFSREYFLQRTNVQYPTQHSVGLSRPITYDKRSINRFSAPVFRTIYCTTFYVWDVNFWR